MSVNNLTKKEFDGIDTDYPLTLRQMTALIAVAADDTTLTIAARRILAETVRQLLDLDDTLTLYTVFRSGYNASNNSARDGGPETVEVWQGRAATPEAAVAAAIADGVTCYNNQRVWAE